MSTVDYAPPESVISVLLSISILHFFRVLVYPEIIPPFCLAIPAGQVCYSSRRFSVKDVTSGLERFHIRFRRAISYLLSGVSSLFRFDTIETCGEQWAALKSHSLIETSFSRRCCIVETECFEHIYQ